jgi:hypothetical protein
MPLSKLDSKSSWSGITHEQGKAPVPQHLPTGDHGLQRRQELAQARYEAWQHDVLRRNCVHLSAAPAQPAVLILSGSPVEHHIVCAHCEKSKRANASRPEFNIFTCMSCRRNKTPAEAVRLGDTLLSVDISCCPACSQ